MPNDDPTLAPAETDGTITVPYPFALYMCVGQVVVMGARVEGALARLLRHLEAERLGQPHTEVIWDAVEKKIRATETKCAPRVWTEVRNALNWAQAWDLRERRNRAVHDQYSILPNDDGVLTLHLVKEKGWATSHPAHQELYAGLRETAGLLQLFEAHLDSLTRWVHDPVVSRMPPPKLPGSTPSLD